jgi:hypothetical protein
MNNQERLDKFKATYKPREEYTFLVALTGEDKFLGVVYKKVEIKSTRFGTKDIAETHIKYVKTGDIKEFIKQLDMYIEQRQVPQLA